jgi:chaperonin GroES
MKKSSKKKGVKPKAPGKSGLGFQPLGDKVLVKPGVPETTTSFGLILPDSAKEKPEQGVVVAAGPGRRSERGERIPMEVKVGDTIFFKKPWDEPLKINGVEYYLISEADITLVKN